MYLHRRAQRSKCYTAETLCIPMPSSQARRIGAFTETLLRPRNTQEPNGLPRFPLVIEHHEP